MRYEIDNTIQINLLIAYTIQINLLPEEKNPTDGIKVMTLIAPVENQQL